MKTFFLLPFLVNFATAVLSAYTVTHATQKGDATGNVVIAFTAAAAIEDDGVIKVTLPTGIDIATAAPAVVAQSATIDGTIVATVSGQVLILTRSNGNDTGAGAAITITVSNIKNPSSPWSSGGTYTIGAYAANGSTQTADAPVADVPAVTFYPALTSTSVLPKSFISNADTRFAIDFTTVTEIPNLGKIKVILPANFDLATLTPAVSGTPSGVDGTWAPTVANQVLTLTQSAGTATAAGAKSFLITNIGNPTTATSVSSGVFQIATYAANGSTMIDLDDVVPAFDIKDSTKRLGSSTKTTIEGSILAVGVSGKTCIGKYIQEDCAHASGSEEVCNPYTKTVANLCLLKADVLLGDTAHGKTGTSDAATPKNSWCVPHTIDANFETTTAGLEKNCKKTEVCNKSSTDATKTCLLKTSLIGGITADWTHLGQLRKPAKKIDTSNDQWCLAKVTAPNVLYFAAQCVSAKGTDAKNPTNTICNPNAKAQADVCVLAHKTLEHGEMATEVKQSVIGDFFYNLNCPHVKGSETVGNWGAAAEAEACIKKKELLNEAEPLNAVRSDAAGKGTEASPLKVCMSKKRTDRKNAFGRCAIDDTTTKDKDETEVCNPNGIKDGSDHEAICVTKTRVLGQGQVVDKAMETAKTNICIGVDASSTCSVDQACDLTTGTCFIAAGKESIVLAAWTEAVDDGTANLCVGKEKTEECTGAGYWCNPLGTTADGKVTPETAQPTSICLLANALHFNGGSICLTYAEDSAKTLADMTSAIKCGEDEPYCDDEGKCSATETVSETTTGATSVDGENPPVDYAATTSIWIGVAIAATLW